MTAGQLIRSARLRAGLTQAELGQRLSMPRSQIARWELEEVEPALATVRKVLRACGFDLSMALVPYGATRTARPRSGSYSASRPRNASGGCSIETRRHEREARRLRPVRDPPRAGGRAGRVRPDRRAGACPARLVRGDRRRRPNTVGARQGNRERLDRALERLGAVEVAGEQSEDGARVFETPVGMIRWVETPAGTRGYPDLRRKARRLHLGAGLRPHAASPGDLVRMLEALGRRDQAPALDAMRRVVELDRGIGVDF